MNEPRRLTRDPDHRMLGGVCSGLAAYYGWDPTLVRVLFLLVSVPAGPITVVAYLAAWLLMPAPEHEGTPRDVMRSNASDMAGSARTAAGQLGGLAREGAQAAREAVRSRRAGGSDDYGSFEPRSAEELTAHDNPGLNSDDPAQRFAAMPGSPGPAAPGESSPTPTWPPPHNPPSVEARADQRPPGQPGTPGA